MTRVLVTGGAGFISSNLCRHLLRATDHEVVIMDALTYAGNTANIADLLGHERLAFVEGDIRDAAHVEEIVAGVDVIVNAAAESHVEKSILDGASEFVTTTSRARRCCSTPPAPSCRALHPGVLERGLRHGRSDPMDEEHRSIRARPAATKPAATPRLQLLVHVRIARGGRGRSTTTARTSTPRRSSRASSRPRCRTGP
jgi:nucleoside-diphosphate-sugar epimerase